MTNVMRIVSAIFVAGIFAGLAAMPAWTQSAPAQTPSPKPNTGHHHLLIDSTLSGDELKQPIPMDDAHRHFGAGQTEAPITSPPGPYKLQLVLGDWSHIPHTPQVMSNVITVRVR